MISAYEKEYIPGVSPYHYHYYICEYLSGNISEQ